MFRRAAASGPASTTAIRDAAPCQKSVRLHVGPDVIAPARAAVLAEVRKRASVPGFRKGKAPVELVERQYAKAIQDETLHRVTQEALERAAKEHSLRPVGPFQVTRADFHETQGFTVEATVEVEPSFVLGSYTGIPLKRQPVDVAPQEMEHALRTLQESMAHLAPSGEGKPKEPHVPPADDELAKDVGFETLGALREHVRAKLLEQKRAASAQTLESALCDELLKRHTFEVPPSLVAHQTDRLTRDFKARRLLSGVPEQQVDQEAATFAEQLRTSAERYVKLSFILQRIAQAESLVVSEPELVERLWQVARRWKKDPAEVRRIFDGRGLWPSVVSTIRQEKTIDFLLASAAVEEAVTSASPAKT